MQVDWRWFPETNRKKWPIDLGESLQADVYDCLILGDLDAEALGDKNIERIVELVEKGIGWITLGGYHAYSAGGYEKTALADLLPMELDKSDKQYFEQPMNDRGHWPGEISLIPRDSHPILELASPKGSRIRRKMRICHGMSFVLAGGNKWKKIKADSGARILAAARTMSADRYFRVRTRTSPLFGFRFELSLVVTREIRAASAILATSRIVDNATRRDSRRFSIDDAEAFDGFGRVGFVQLGLESRLEVGADAEGDRDSLVARR